MIELSFIRHGKTQGNLLRQYVGRSDQPLSQEGLSELFVLKSRYPAVQSVFSSPMRRCRETAGMLYPGFESNLIEDFREMDFGDFECMTHEEIIALSGNADWGMDESRMQFPGGEDLDIFKKRCYDGFKTLIQTCLLENLKSAAVVIHGGVIMALMDRYCNENRMYYAWMCNNGCGYATVWDGERLVLKGGLPL